MKVFCILTSFLFVNVSTNEDTDYKEAVVITNKHIELAYNKKDITVGNQFFANGLERVISKFLDVEETNRFVILKLNNMFAAPEYCDEEFYKRECSGFQRDLQNEIKTLLDIDIPVLQDQNFRGLYLEQLGDERRRFTGKVLKYMMKPYLDLENLTSLIENRRSRPTESTEALNNRINHPDKVPLLQMCRLIALSFANIIPQLYTTHFRISEEEDRTCFLSDRRFPTKRYREIIGEWWQVNLRNPDERIQPLREQLVTLDLDLSHLRI